MYTNQKKSFIKKKIIWLKIGLLTTMLIFVEFLNAQNYSQPITLNLRNATFKEFVKQIESKTQFTVVFRDALVDNKNDISINVSNKPLTEVIKSVLAMKGLYANYKNNTIVITKIESNTLPTEELPAKNKKITGLVTDSKGEPIIGANITIKGGSMGTISDNNGKFTIQAEENDILLVSSIGFKRQEVKLTDKEIISVVLIDDQKMLDEVMVIGYGQVRKGDATGALVSVKADDKVRGFAPNAQDLLTGKVAGVSIINEGGSPNGMSYIRIRGGSSLTASNDPLIIVDGVFIDNSGINGVGNILNTINPTDIESFTVLKDASATAIYGSRASNGVILITTKKGTNEKMKIIYDGNFSIGTRKKEIAVMTGDEFRVFLKENYSDLSIYNEISKLQGLVNTDWQDVIFQTTFNNEHNLSLYGGIGKKSPYRVSLGYTNQDGILKTSKMERYTGSFSLTPTLFDDHLKITLNGRGMHVNNRFADWGAIGAAIVMDPSQAVYDKDSPYGGYYTWLGSDGNVIQVATKNPLSMLEMTKDLSSVNNFIGNIQIDYKLHFFPDLRFNLNAGIDYSKGSGTKYISEFSPSDAMYGGYNSSWNQKKQNSTLDFYGQYSKNIKSFDSHFDIMGGYSWQHYWSAGDGVGYRITQFDKYGDPILVTESNYETEHYIISFFGRMNYDISGKYLFTATIRDDGSSRFSKQNRWALFPSLALGWRLSEENFIKNLNSISNLKLRLSWGVTGQQDINQGDYPYIATYLRSVGDQANYLRGYENNIPIWVSLLRPEAYNPNLKWESTATYNIGLDFGFLKNRIEGSLDLYHRITTNLINATTKTTAGTNFKEYVAANIGSLENTGVELAVNSHPIVKHDFSWEIGANLAYNQNKITKLSIGDDKNTKNVNGVVVNMVGYPTNMYFVYEQIYNANGKPIEGLYKDQNNDGQINEQDLRPYKKATGDVTFGINTKLTRKAWDLSVSSHGSLGNYNYNAIAASYAGLSPTSVFSSETLSNRVKSAFDTNFQISQPLSDYYVQNASFFRIDNIVLGWSFGKSKLVPISGRLYSSVQNPFVFTKYKGIDPEVFGGYDGNLYPRPLTILFGTNLNF